MNKVTRTTAIDKVKADSISRIETAARVSRYSIKPAPSDSGTVAAAKIRRNLARGPCASRHSASESPESHRPAGVGPLRPQAPLRPETPAWAVCPRPQEYPRQSDERSYNGSAPEHWAWIGPGSTQETGRIGRNARTPRTAACNTAISSKVS